MVSEYTGLNILEVNNLEWIEYLQYRRDAFIYQQSKTEAGQEYLSNAFRLEQTSPERSKLKRFKK